MIPHSGLKLSFLYILYSRMNWLKTTPFIVVHTHTAYLWDSSPPPNICEKKMFLKVFIRFEDFCKAETMTSSSRISYKIWARDSHPLPLIFGVFSLN